MDQAKLKAYERLRELLAESESANYSWVKKKARDLKSAHRHCIKKHERATG